MKYHRLFLFVLCCIFLFVDCTNIDEVNDSLDRVEGHVSTLQEAYNNGKIISKVEALTTGQTGWLITFSDNTTLTVVNSIFKSVHVNEGFVIFEMADGTSFMFKRESDVVVPKLLKMEFRATANPQEMIEDATCTIIGDSVVDCWIRNIMEDKLLIPHFSYEGDEVTVGDEVLTSGVSHYDFKAPVVLKVKAKDVVKEYRVFVHAFTGLPVLWIETKDRAEIVSKDNYLYAHFKLVEEVETRSAGDVVEIDGQIKGRGNSTWSEMPKKPYALKFNEKVSFLNEPNDKSWILLANYADKTTLRTATAFYMSNISNLEYTPQFHFVEVMLNGRYNGIYQLGDKLKISKNRVNVGNDGFLMEIDAKAEADEITFSTNHIGVPVNIKDPDLQVGDENYNYIKDFVINAENVLFSENFKDPKDGWQKYMDIDSFVDWYLINEIAKNNDAIFFSSCYMHLKRGDKLKMGPVWDFDIAFGNVNYSENYETSGFWIKQATWFNRLFDDPAFVEKVKARFAFFYNHQDDIMSNINANARYLRYSVQENENRWHTFYIYTWPNYDIWGSYMNEVQYLKNWLAERFKWLKSEFDKM